MNAPHASVEPDVTLRYADHADGILDVHLPGVPAAPLIALLHGGFWRARYDRTHTREQAAALRALGYVVVTPEYRRAGAGGGWPATFDDVRRALTEAPALLAPHVQVATTTAVGHSAGGHLALWLSTQVPIERVVALAPVGDLRHAWDNGIGGTAIADFLGRPRPDADPARLLAAAPPARPIVIVHGDRDDDVPVANSDWARAVPGIDLRVLPGAGHLDLIDPRSAAWPHVVAAIQSGPTEAS